MGFTLHYVNYPTIFSGWGVSVVFHKVDVNNIIIINMESEFIPYKEALTVKELGFNKPCFGWYASDKTLIMEHTKKTDFLLAPTFSQAFRFFREKYELTSWIYNSDTTKFFYTILQNGRIVKSHDSSTTYEESELACLIKLIEIVKNK